MIKNYIFDFGNVLGEFYPERLTAPFVSDPSLVKEISEVVFDRAYWNRLDNGTISDEEVKNEIMARLGEDLGRAGCMAYDNWVKTMTPVKGMQKLVEDIHNEGANLYLISNISIGFAQTYKEVEWIKDLLGLFDGLVFSGVVNMVKPQGEIFNHLLSQFNLKAEECLFIDDSIKNINGAKDVGIKGYLFDGDAEKLRKYISQFTMK